MGKIKYLELVIISISCLSFLGSNKIPTLAYDKIDVYNDSASNTGQPSYKRDIFISINNKTVHVYRYKDMLLKCFKIVIVGILRTRISSYQLNLWPLRVSYWARNLLCRQIIWMKPV